MNCFDAALTVSGMVMHPGDIIVGDEDGVPASIVNGSFDRARVAPQRDRMMNS
jgi:regulator of RNase E activity RraA